MYLEINIPSNCHILQCKLVFFKQWTDRLGLRLNCDKCHVITFVRCRNPIHHSYSLNGRSLSRIFLYKDICVNLNPTLNYDHYINNTIGKTHKVMGYVKRNIKIFCSLKFSMHFISFWFVSTKNMA